MVSKPCATPFDLGLCNIKTQQRQADLVKIGNLKCSYILMRGYHLNKLDVDDQIKLIKFANQAQSKAKWVLNHIDLSSNLGQKVFHENENVLRISHNYAIELLKDYEQYCST